MLTCPSNNKHSIFLPSLLSFLAAASCATPAQSQRDYDPNFSHFYMGRQQWTIEDNSPVIINRTGTAPGAMNGALPNRPIPLPKAGWQGYAPIDNPPSASSNSKSTPSSRNSKTKRTVGNAGKAGILGKNANPSAIQSYKPYNTYPSANATQNPANLQQSSQHVKGSLLHWARRTPKSE